MTIRTEQDHSNCKVCRSTSINEEIKLIDNFSRVKKWKTFLSVGALFASWLANDVALACIHERVPYRSDPLPDVFFSLFPECQWAIKIAEIFILISLVLTFGTIFLHRHSWIVARRTFMISSMCYFMRAVCISVTQVPVPSRNTYCGPVANETSISLVLNRVGWTLSTMGLDLYNRRVLCGDLIFSGHTTVLMLSFLITNKYLPNNFKFLSYISKMTAIIGPFCILLARKHYTLDVLLAVVIVSLTFSVYHKMIEQKFHKIQGHQKISQNHHINLHCQKLHGNQRKLRNHKENSSSLPSLDALVRFMESDIDKLVKNKFRRFDSRNVYNVT